MKSALLFDIVPCMHQLKPEGYFILHVVHIAGTRMIKAGIDGLLLGNNLGGMMIGTEPLKFVPVDVG